MEKKQPGITLKLYMKQKVKDLKIISKLTDAHVYPTNFQRMKVKYEVQVLSSTMVSGNATIIIQQHLQPKIRINRFTIISKHLFTEMTTLL